MTKRNINIRHKTTQYLLIITLLYLVLNKSALATFEDTNYYNFYNTVNDLSSVLSKAYNVKDSEAKKFAQYIIMSSTTSGTPIRILSSLIMTESSYRVNVKSSAGAIGPAQIIAKYWDDYCEGNLSDAKTNILCSGKILKKYHKQAKSNWDLALRYYNVGPKNYNNSEKFRKASDRYIAKIKKNIHLFDISIKALDVAFLDNFNK